MQFISPEDVPDFIKNSKLFASYVDPDEVIPVPETAFKDNEVISSEDDFNRLLEIMRYWGLLSIPRSVLVHCWTSDTSVVVQAIEKYPELAFLKVMRNVKKEKEDVLLVAASAGMRDVVEYLETKFRFKRVHAAAVIAGGNVRCVQYVAEVHLEMVPRDVCVTFAGRGQLECLQLFLPRRGFTVSSVCEAAAAGGHLACLEYAAAHGCPWNKLTLLAAIRNRHLPCFQFVAKSGCPGDADVVVECAKTGLDWLKTSYEGKYPWDERVSTTIVTKGLPDYVDMLRYACSHSCPVDDGCLAIAAGRGDIECVELLREQHCPWSAEACARAAQNNYLECLWYLLSNGCPWHVDACLAAAQKGSLECLQILREFGCPWHVDAACTAARHGHQKFLEYALDHQCPRDARVTYLAASNKHWECAKSAFERGCPWRDDPLLPTASDAALIQGDLNMLKWVLKHNCPAPQHASMKLTNHNAPGQTACINFLKLGR